MGHVRPTRGSVDSLGSAGLRGRPLNNESQQPEIPWLHQWTDCSWWA